MEELRFVSMIALSMTSGKKENTKNSLPFNA